MPDRPKLSRFTPALAAAAVLLLVAPALADGPPSNPVMQFLMIDNPVGTTLIWSCMLISVAVVSLIIQNILQIRMSLFVPPELFEALERLLAEKNYREAIEITAGDQTPLGQVMRAALAESPRGFQAMEAAIEETADTVGNRRVRGLVWLEIAGAAGPMIGLFGTVFGMILAFQHLVAAGGAPKAQDLAGGIGTALVCTFWGLVVGIPGVITASLFRVRVEGLTAELIVQAKILISGFRPGAVRKPSAPTPEAPSAPASGAGPNSTKPTPAPA